MTLGGTGKDRGDRHPKLGNGILIGAGALILGNIRIGDGCKIAAGSVVLMSLPAHTTAAGVPAKVVGRAMEENPGMELDHSLENVKYYEQRGLQARAPGSKSTLPSLSVEAAKAMAIKATNMHGQKDMRGQAREPAALESGKLRSNL